LKALSFLAERKKKKEEEELRRECVSCGDPFTLPHKNYSILKKCPACSFLKEERDTALKEEELWYQNIEEVSHSMAFIGRTFEITEDQDPYVYAERNSFREYILDKVLSQKNGWGNITPQEKEVMVLRYHLSIPIETTHYHKPLQLLTFGDIAEILGLSRERIRQIERSSIRKLRHPNSKATRALRYYSDSGFYSGFSTQTDPVPLFPNNANFNLSRGGKAYNKSSQDRYNLRFTPRDSKKKCVPQEDLQEDLHKTTESPARGTTEQESRRDWHSVSPERFLELKVEYSRIQKREESRGQKNKNPLELFEEAATLVNLQEELSSLVDEQARSTTILKKMENLRGNSFPIENELFFGGMTLELLEKEIYSKRDFIYSLKARIRRLKASILERF